MIERGRRMLYAMSWYIMYQLTRSSSRTFGFVGRGRRKPPCKSMKAMGLVGPQSIVGGGVKGRMKLAQNSTPPHQQRIKTPHIRLPSEAQVSFFRIPEAIALGSSEEEELMMS